MALTCAEMLFDAHRALDAFFVLQDNDNAAEDTLILGRALWDGLTRDTSNVKDRIAVAISRPATHPQPKGKSALVKWAALNENVCIVSWHAMRIDYTHNRSPNLPYPLHG